MVVIMREAIIQGEIVQGTIIWGTIVQGAIMRGAIVLLPIKLKQITKLNLKIIVFNDVSFLLSKNMFFFIKKN